MIDLEQFNKDVQLSIESGVKPIEFRFFPIVDMEDGIPVAYRSEITIHSIILGEMQEKFYTRVSDVRDCGVAFFEHALTRLILILKDFEKKGKDVKFVSVRCPAELIGKVDFYKTVKQAITTNGAFDKSKMCIEFPSNILKVDEEKARIAVLDIRSLGVKTAIKGCGEKDFPITKLTTVTPDIVYMDSSVSTWADDRNKPHLFESFVSFVRYMGTEVIVEAEDKYRKVMRKTECEGFLSTSTQSLSYEEILED